MGTGGMGHMGSGNTWGSRVQCMDYSGYQPHGQWGNRVQGVWGTGVWAIGHMGQWGTGHMGNGYRGCGPHGVIGYRG